ASTKSEWQQAMIEEIQALQTQGTWDLVPPPSDKNIVGCRWIYKIKRHADGRIARYKARLVAQGFSQEQGIDFDETFSPVVRHTT
ncbi:PREDICTED: Retrovirus-related Pol poly from transposon, partial [Prunus dulcis]